MSVKGKKKHFSNGYYTNEEWLKLVIDEEKFDEYKRKFNTKKGGSKCPPVTLTDDGACYYCQNCFDNCAEYVKEYKKHYMIRNEKFLKVDLESGGDK